MNKVSIKNRKGQKLAVIVEQIPHQKGIAFVMHGLGGFKNQPHIQTMAEAFLDNGYTVIRFDTTNTLGESAGKYEDATTTNYYEDLEDTISWSKSQPWYQEPFILAGHSLGGISTALYAEKYPEQVVALAPISTVVSGQLIWEAAELENKAELEEWKDIGWRIRLSSTPPYVEKRLKWSHMADRLNYDLMPNVAKLTMPVLMIVGDQDDSCPPEHQKVLFDKLPGKKELHIIPGAPHTFREPEHLARVKALFGQWIKGLV